MQYSKPSLSFEEQADQMLRRGFMAPREELIQLLQRVGYYRLSGFLFPFRNSDDTYQSGVDLNLLISLHGFDRDFRLLIFDALERVEISVRAQCIQSFSQRFGAFGYIERSNFSPYEHKNFRVKHENWLTSLRTEVQRSEEIFIKHFNATYGDYHPMPPIWMAAEVMSMGRLLDFFRLCRYEVQQDVAIFFGMPTEVIESWLVTLNHVRNLCAHHQRLWNRKINYLPKLPSRHKNPDWFTCGPYTNEHLFAIVLILRYLLKRCAPDSDWASRLESLMDRYPPISLKYLGFPVDWKKNPIWARPA